VKLVFRGRCAAETIGGEQSRSFCGARIEESHQGRHSGRLHADWSTMSKWQRRIYRLT
jgi:hypothetical protein